MNVARQLLPVHRHARYDLRGADSCTSRAYVASTPTARVLVPAWQANSIEHEPSEHEPLLISTPVQRSLLVSTEVRDLVVSLDQHSQLDVQQQGENAILTNTPSQEGPQGATAGQPMHVPDDALIQQLSRDLGINKERMQRIVRRWGPRLYSENLELVSMRLHNLSALLRCKPAEAAAAVSQEPRLLHMQTPALQQQVEGLSNNLQVPVPTVLALCLHNPSLLYEQPELVCSRAQQAAAAMQVALPQFMEAACEEPWLLKAPPETIASRVQSVSKLLQLQPGHQLMLSHPRLVCMTRQDITAKLQCIGRCLHMSPTTSRELVRAYPALLNFSTAHIESTITTISQHIPLAQLQYMAFREPSLLCRTATRVCRRLQFLRSLLACSKEAVVELVARRPCLLTHNSACLTSSYKALSIWKLSQEDKRQLISAHPSLLRLHGGEVHGRCRWLRELMLRNGYFHSALRELPMNLLGRIILHLPHAWSRLQYLAESNHETGVDLVGITAIKDAQFRKLHPGFERWLSWRTAELGASAPWRVPQAYQQNAGWKRRPAVSKRHAAAAGAAAVPHPSLAQAGHVVPGVWPGSASQSVMQASGSVGAAAAEGSVPPADLQEVVQVHEARTFLLGGHCVRKPRRVVSVRVPVTGSTSGDEETAATAPQVAGAHPEPGPAAASDAVRDAAL